MLGDTSPRAFEYRIGDIANRHVTPETVTLSAGRSSAARFANDDVIDCTATVLGPLDTEYQLLLQFVVGRIWTTLQRDT